MDPLEGCSLNFMDSGCQVSEGELEEGDKFLEGLGVRCGPFERHL